jgi:alanyl-tRNA synthetase
VKHIQHVEGLLKQAARRLKDSPEAIPNKVDKLLSDCKALEKEVGRLKGKMATLTAAGAEETLKTVNGVKVIVKQVPVEKPAALRDLADQFKEKIKSGIVVLGSDAGGKALLIAVVTKDLVKRYHAGKIVKELAAMVGGSGGGRPDMAQAGGTQPENLTRALQKAYEVIENC